MQKFMFCLAFICLFLVGGFSMPGKAEAAPFGLPFNIAKPLGMKVAPEINTEEHAIYLTFSNLALVKNATYQLTYKADGIDRGVKGELEPYKNTPIVRRIFFGACSGDICVLDDKITAIKISVEAEYFFFGKTKTEEFGVPEPGK